jgi:hypothetical protein
MADPVTLMIASAAISAVGSIQAGQAAQDQANAAAQANQYNAKVKEMQAGIERQQANAREEQQRRKARQILGEQRAGIAQAGIGMMGSALDISEESATRAELDSLTIRYEGELAAKGMLADAVAERYEAGVNRMAGRNAMTGAYLSAGSAILSGASRYSGYQRTGKMS